VINAIKLFFRKIEKPVMQPIFWKPESVCVTYRNCWATKAARQLRFKRTNHEAQNILFNKHVYTR